MVGFLSSSSVEGFQEEGNTVEELLPSVQPAGKSAGGVFYRMMDVDSLVHPEW